MLHICLISGVLEVVSRKSQPFTVLTLHFFFYLLCFFFFVGSHYFPLIFVSTFFTYPSHPFAVRVWFPVSWLFSSTSQKAFLRPQGISKNRVVSFHNGQMNEKKRIRIHFSENSANRSLKNWV